MKTVPTTIESSDAGLICLLRNQGPQSISQISQSMNVTATAVRQRLARLMSLGLIVRKPWKAPRGRPGHHYTLTEEGLRSGSNNFADLTIVIWQEIRDIRDPQIRTGLLQRLAQRFAKEYAPRVQGSSLRERLESIARIFTEKSIPFNVETATFESPSKNNVISTSDPDNKVSGTNSASLTPNSSALPILTAHACPYPALAEQDRGICAVENLMLSELVGQRMKLTECRLDGGACCRFETSP
ncbi:MAG: winged helix DNA-binding protein [Pirellulales bacterium]|nr:winged helix DNA-binding protein [Pirellulales bacterium]